MKSYLQLPGSAEVGAHEGRHESSAVEHGQRQQINDGGRLTEVAPTQNDDGERVSDQPKDEHRREDIRPTGQLDGSVDVVMTLLILRVVHR